MPNAPTRIAVCVACGLLFAACVTYPTGPSVTVLPGSSTSFEQFQADDMVCRDWAARQTGTSVDQAATESGVAVAAAATGVGAATGAAIGAAAGDPGAGAAIGAGTGLLVGSAAGSSRAHHVGAEVQHRYDAAYVQCMYAKGNQIPVSRGSVPGAGAPPRSGGRGIPPPPPGRPPPPPPGTG